MDEKLIEFIDHAQGKGLDHATIRQLLLAAGWKDKDIAAAICARDLGIPIPRPARTDVSSAPGARRSVSPWPRRAREAFLNILAFGALFTSATSLILLLVTYIDFAFPDPAWRVSHAMLAEILSIMRFQLATLIVSFPLFLVLWHFLLREVRTDPEKARGAIRRWLAYLTIFIGALTLSGDVMTLIYFLLEGQMTLRFLLKAGVLFLIAGSLVLYLAHTLRTESDAAK